MSMLIRSWHSSQNVLDHDAVLNAHSLFQRKILDAIQQSYAGLKEELVMLSSSLNDARREDRTQLVRVWQADNKENLNLLSGRLSTVTEDAQIMATQTKLLDSLYFSRIEERRERIPEAHKQTFKWIFGGIKEDGTWWDHFVHWLEDQVVRENVFWVSGKAGSGKSTLMRFLDNNDATKYHLRNWAGTKKLLVASCFFWKSGTSIQKSLSGLLRSLLHQLLSQDQDLAASVDPWRWRALYLGSSRLDDWTDIELKKAFDRFIASAYQNSRIALFVDGLDELDGNDEQQQDLIDLFIRVASCPDVKICVSSRPWNIFQDSFAEYPKLRLELLTRDDIKHYVQDVLEGSPRFRLISSLDPIQSAGLVTEIVEKASGVFLWVYLVVRELHKGLRDGFDLRMLSRRLLKLPGDLDAYFLQMITSIDEADRSIASRIFQLVLNARQHLTLMTLSFIEEENVDYALENMYIPNTKMAVVALRNDSMVRRLNSLCMGLLEPKEIASFVNSQKTPESLSSWKLEVDYLHRTVKDFLLSEQSQQTLRSYTGSEYDTDRYLSNSFASQIMLLDALAKTEYEAFHPWAQDQKSLLFFEFVDEFMFYIERIERASRNSPTALINKTKDVILRQIPAVDGAIPGTWQTSIGWEAVGHWQEWKCSFLTLSIQYNLGLHAIATLKAEPRRGTVGRPLLDFALRRWSSNPHVQLPPHTELVATILASGADPNEIYDRASLWDHFILYLRRQELHDPKTNIPFVQTTELLIKYGAAKTDWATRELSRIFDEETSRKLQWLFTEAKHTPFTGAKHTSFGRRFMSGLSKALN